MNERKKSKKNPLQRCIKENLAVYSTSTLSLSTLPKKLDIGFQRSCACKNSNINCMTPKEWLKSQIGVWQFFYEKRDIRDRMVHPATFPISLSKKIISLFTHEGGTCIRSFCRQWNNFSRRKRFK